MYAISVISNIFSASPQSLVMSSGGPTPVSDVIEIQIIRAIIKKVIRSAGGDLTSSGCSNSHEPSVTTATKL